MLSFKELLETHGPAIVNGRAFYNNMWPALVPIAYDKGALSNYFSSFLRTNGPSGYAGYFSWFSASLLGQARYSGYSCTIFLNYESHERGTSTAQQLARKLAKVFVHEFVHYMEYAHYGNRREKYFSGVPENNYWTKNTEMNAWATDAANELGHHLTDDQVRTAIHSKNYDLLARHSIAIREYMQESHGVFKEFLARVLHLMELDNSNYVPNADPRNARPAPQRRPPVRSSGGTTVTINGVDVTRMQASISKNGSYTINYNS